MQIIRVSSECTRMHNIFFASLFFTQFSRGGTANVGSGRHAPSLLLYPLCFGHVASPYLQVDLPTHTLTSLEPLRYRGLTVCTVCIPGVAGSRWGAAQEWEWIMASGLLYSHNCLYTIYIYAV